MKRKTKKDKNYVWLGGLGFILSFISLALLFGEIMNHPKGLMPALIYILAACIGIILMELFGGDDGMPSAGVY